MLCVFVTPTVAQQNPEKLLSLLQDESTTDGAAGRLLKMAKSDSATRKYLANQLPALIDQGPGKSRSGPEGSDPVWWNEVKLAGQLKIGEAAPSLAKWIGEGTSEATASTLGSQSRLEGYPAGRALIRIGDPAVPAIQEILSSPQLRLRWLAAYALHDINTPSARQALRTAAEKESDESLVQFMKSSS